MNNPINKSAIKLFLVLLLAVFVADETFALYAKNLKGKNKNSVFIENNANDPRSQRARKRALAMELSNTAAFADNILIPDELPPATSGNILEILQGRVPGVWVSNWGWNYRVSIRGSRYQPLFVLDGMPVHPDIVTAINPFDVATVEVHRSAIAAGYWGGRAAGGVIVINTKRGDW